MSTMPPVVCTELQKSSGIAVNTQGECTESTITLNSASIGISTAVLVPESQEKINSILSSISRYFTTNINVNLASITSLVREAYEHTDSVFTVASAAAWGGNFVFNNEDIASDVEAFRRCGGLSQLAASKQRLLAHNRLSVQRIDNTISILNPDRERLLELAGGIRAPVSTGFHPNGSQPRVKLRTLYLQARAAVNKLHQKTWEKGLAILLPRHLVEESGMAYHISAAHWCLKKNHAEGRGLIDATDSSRGSALNSDDVQCKSISRWGSIYHPTITDIVEMIWIFYRRELEKNPNCRWEDMRLWKMDLKGAYTLLSFHPESVHLFGMELSDDIIIFFLCGVFGWTGTPFAFQVLTRAILFELRPKIPGLCFMYVDDLMGVCWVYYLMEDLSIARCLCTDLLGPDAVADDKTEMGRRLDILGYIIDLDSKLLSIARKNFLNSLYWFFSVDLEGFTNLLELQRLGSVASRYGVICRFGRPFNSAIHAATKNLRSQVRIRFPSYTKRAIRIWRAIMVLVGLDERQVARSLGTFALPKPLIIAETDASLTGVGVLIYRRMNGHDVFLGGGGADITKLGFGADSSFQNLAEFSGAVLALVCIVKLGLLGEIQDTGFGLRGDSISALTWLEKERYRGSTVCNASIIYTLLGLRCRTQVSEAEHISAALNYRADSLSRLSESGRSATEDLIHMGFEDAEAVELDMDIHVGLLLEYMDPSFNIDSEEGFLMFWKGVNSAVEGICGSVASS